MTVLYDEGQDRFVLTEVTADAISEKVAEWQLEETELTALIQKSLAANTEDTFALVLRDEEIISQTYNEWESYRVGQAFESVVAKTNDEQIQAILTHFKDNMQLKYAGKQSWQAIFESLLDDLK